MDDKELNDILNEWDSKDKRSEVQDGGDTVPAAQEPPGEVYIPEEEIERTSDDDDTEDDEDEYDEEEYDDEDEDRRSRRKRKKRSGAGRVIFALVMVTLVISVAALSAAGVIIVTKELLGLDRIDEKVDIEIPENSSSSEIADMLAQEGIIERPVLFKIFSRLKGADGSFIAGVHVLNPNMTYNDIIETLQENVEADREYVTLTFPEGIRLDEAAEKLEEAGVCS
ncbi:MAG: endolytic transglycosylase MltG, partial [Oscillospiraceae bacterium]|nr:endolytic transglycosylase MltG [Oscillospiraceae bacterium]